ncbi:SPW repeat domain-containing protein [Pontibacter anaerobius]|uniref:SPW repeat protein n=1 Tax=Pontibacter anaerobius TaxID=2993940 RepID=A0ABT3RDW8_9BACT|nr:SPW repeat protein [Pontibacter anaerobius]MCX2740048.1 SPW repeat protein [Pontibacter anaerobius]
MWAQIINAVLGIWLMASAAILGYSDVKIITDNEHIVGPIVASFAIISWWEATRVVRLYNVLPGLWLLLAPWVLGYDNGLATTNSMVAGALITGLSFVKGKVEETYGGGWSAIWKSDTLHAREARKQPRTDLEG